MATIRFDQVTKHYEGTASGTNAVENLCLDIQDGEFLVLVGPSGCGKTTSLRMLAGLESISTGDLYLSDRRINDLPAKDRNMAMVFQSYALYPHMTVFENMAFALKLRGLSKSTLQQRILQVAQQLEIGHLLERKPGQLSGGQRQRVAVGRAMVRNPTAFLMDEPLSNLDAQLRGQARVELSKLHQNLGTTFVYVTHDQVEAMTLGTRIAVMNQGVLQQVDVPQRVYDFPDNRFVASFLGSPAMNFLEVQIQQPSDASDSPPSDDGQWCLSHSAFQLPLPAPDRWSPPQTFPVVSGTALILGLRPEDFYFPNGAPSQVCTTPLELTITLIEPMGYELLVYGQLDNQEAIVARLDPRLKPQHFNLMAGQRITLEVDQHRFHLFDPTTEVALFHRHRL